MNLENVLSKIESEVKGIKDAYAQIARQIPVHSYQIDFQCTPNQITSANETWTMAGRTVVTFNTFTGSNTLAILQVKVPDDYIENVHGFYSLRRIPYSGGARWLVMCGLPDAVLTFRVLAATQGSLEAKMIWQ